MTNVLLYLNRNTECIRIPSKNEKYLLVDNFLSEYLSDEEKRLVLLNILLLDRVPTENSTNLINSGDLYNILLNISCSNNNITVEINDIDYNPTTEKLILEYKEIVITTSDGNQVKFNTIVLVKLLKSTFVITFNTSGGNPIDSLTVIEGLSITLPTPTHSDLNKLFVGWYLNPNYTGTKYTTTYTPTGNVTLYAKWENKTKVYFKNLETTITIDEITTKLDSYEINNSPYTGVSLSLRYFYIAYPSNKTFSITTESSLPDSYEDDFEEIGTKEINGTTYVLKYLDLLEFPFTETTSKITIE